MTRPDAATSPPDADDPARAAEAGRVAAYLAAHPGFLADRPDLYRTLAPPRRVHGDRLADHMAAMLALARSETAAVAGAAGASRDFTLRAAGAAMSLMGAADPLSVVAHEWPALLGLETAILATEGPPAANRRDLPPGTVARLLGARDLLLRDGPLAEAEALHGEAAATLRRDALIRVPGDLPTLLALGARDAARLPSSGTGGALRLLATAVARALGG